MHSWLSQYIMKSLGSSNHTSSSLCRRVVQKKDYNRQKYDSIHQSIPEVVDNMEEELADGWDRIAQ